MDVLSAAPISKDSSVKNFNNGVAGGDIGDVVGDDVGDGSGRCLSSFADGNISGKSNMSACRRRVPFSAK